MATPNEVAQKLILLIPPLMHSMREEISRVAKERESALTLPQYRILANVYRGLNQVGKIARHHGVSQPGMSKMVDLLVQKKFLEKKTESLDRRQSILSLTPMGEEEFLKVRSCVQKKMARQLEGQSPRDLDHALNVIQLLQKTYLGASFNKSFLANTDLGVSIQKSEKKTAKKTKKRNS